MDKNDIDLVALSHDSNGKRICLMLQKKNDGSIFYKEEIRFLEAIVEVIGIKVI